MNQTSLAHSAGGIGLEVVHYSLGREAFRYDHGMNVLKAHVERQQQPPTMSTHLYDGAFDDLTHRRRDADWSMSEFTRFELGEHGVMRP